MPYTTLASVKLDLGISWNNQDSILWKMITDADVYINSSLRIDGFDRVDITESIEMKPSAQVSIYNKVYLKNFNVTAIKEINGIAYTGVLNTDYTIQYGRILNIRNINEYISTMYFPYLTIKYTCGFVRYNAWPPVVEETLPADIELMARLLIAGLYHQKYPMWYLASANGIQASENVTQYRLWDESISFGKAWSFTSFRSPDEASQFQQLFSKYKKANVI